jgi:hypothetical protein
MDEALIDDTGRGTQPGVKGMAWVVQDVVIDASVLGGQAVVTLLAPLAGEPKELDRNVW